MDTLAVLAGVVLTLTVRLARLVLPALAGVAAIPAALVARLRIAARLAHLRIVALLVVATPVVVALLAIGD